MLNYRYVSLGYVGGVENFSTLNSSYISYFLGRDLPSDIILFPQRIPKIDFFKELCFLEEKKFQNQFNKIQSKLLKSSKAYLKKAALDGKESRILINLMHFMLRRGLCSEICVFKKPFIKNKENSYEFDLISASAKIECDLSANKEVNLRDLGNLIEIIISDQDKLSSRLIVMATMRFLVCIFRYKCHWSMNKKLLNSAMKLAFEKTSLLERSNDFSSHFIASIAYRGLAMAPNFKTSYKAKLLKKAEILARELQPRTHTEIILYKENLYTLLQTLAKWSVFQRDLCRAEFMFHEMLRVDPNDSTGYSEIGFFYFKMDDYRKASLYFKKAFELGPPGVGLNMYFYAKCLQFLSLVEKAIKIFEKIMVLDPIAISPYLDLIEILVEKNEMKRAKKLADKALKTPVLFDQLTPDEVNKLKLVA